MKQKLIILALVMGLTIVSQSSFSLGMGKIRVYSALNEPLRSNINLITNADEVLENLEVRLASSEDYQKVGLDRSFVPANISVAFDEENPYQINVTSNGPLTEPIVSLLLDVNWDNGRILREFTILLDPPVYESTNADVQVNSVVVEPIAEESTIDLVEPVAEATDSGSESITYTNEDVADYQDTSVSYASGADEVTVQAGDTLWSIANSNKVGDLTTHQMVMAIYNANPDAFVDNNINRLVKGSRLNMPSADEARDIGYTEALEQVRFHNQSWSPAVSDYASIQTETTVDDTYETPASTLDYGVQLTGSEASDSDNGQSNSDISSSESAMAIEEDLLTTETENAELKERISELEDIVDQQQDILEVADDGLANLENQLANAGDEVEQVVDDAANDLVEGANDMVDAAVSDVENTADDIWDTVSTDVADTESDLSLAVEGVEDTTEDTLNAGEFNDVASDDVTPEPAAVAEKPVVKTAVVQRKPEPSFMEKAMDWIMSNLMWLLIGLAGLLALIFVPRFLGGSSDDDEEDGTSFLDDIKSRNKAETDDMDDLEEVADEADTKMNQPLMDDEDLTSDDETVEDDVLADLDSSINFEADDSDVVEELVEEVADELVIEQDDTDGFDLDGFLNDDGENSDISDTIDHSETLAGVDFGDDSESDFDLDITDEVEETVTEIAEEAEGAVEDIKENIEDTADAVADEFSFDDDESFDFDLDEELEELEQAEGVDLAKEVEDAVSDVGDDVDVAVDSLEDEFNDMVDISDDKVADSFENVEEELSEEIDLGLEDLMEETDAIGTKLDLAKAYIDMGDADGAKNLLDEVFAEGSEEQIAEAKKLLDNM